MFMLNFYMSLFNMEILKLTYICGLWKLQGIWLLIPYTKLVCAWLHDNMLPNSVH